MSRIARVVVPGLPHHITQRGVGRQVVFPSDRLRRLYLTLLRENARRFGVRLLGYCLMSNHVHLLAVPESTDSLARALRRAHGRYALYANADFSRIGHFWQSRFWSCPVEESAVGHVLAYIERNPVAAGLVANATDFRWSSAPIHLGMQRDQMELLDLEWWNSRWTPREWLQVLRGAPEFDIDAVREATRTGRPFGSPEFVRRLENSLGRRLTPSPGGRPRKSTPREHPVPATLVA